MIITFQDLKVGDILLYYSSFAPINDENKNENEIVTGYTHASIYLGNNYIAESTKSGVQKRTIKESMEDYQHIAVTRQPDAWNEKNIVRLRIFIDSRIQDCSKFNARGVKNFKVNRKENRQEENNNLQDYFNGIYKPFSPIKNKYFCSELIVSAFLSIGFISEAVGIIHNPETTSPLSLGKNYIFGTFLGYIKDYDEYVIPKNDDFIEDDSYYDLFD